MALDRRDLVGAGADDEVILGRPVEHLLLGLVDADGHVKGAARRTRQPVGLSVRAR
jgi:hypothetical protein